MIIRDKMPLIMSLYKRGSLINEACQVKYKQEKTQENKLTFEKCKLR